MQKLAVLVLLVGSGVFAPITSADASPASAGSPGEFASSATPQPVGQTGTWNLIFSDEFNGTALDQTKWTPGWFGTGITGPVNSGELACYDSKHVTVPGDGTVHLRMDATPNTCKGHSMPYTGALASSNGLFGYAYGYVEFRVYLPASSPGQIANWPGTWSDGQSWPADGENDTMEGLGGPACYHFHSTVGGPGSCASGNYTGWHTYASNWQPGAVSYFYDGVKVGTITSGITAAKQYLVLQYTLNSSRQATVPSEMLVDYVRVWTSSTTVSTSSKCSLATLSPSSVTQVAGSTVNFTGASGGCTSPSYAYWVRMLDGKWYMKRGFSTDANWSWSTAGLRPGSYIVHLWANQTGHSTSALEAMGQSTVKLTGCTSATLSPARGSVRAGTSVAFAAGSSGCPNPVYEFWLRDTTGRWHRMTGFGGNTWTWNNTGWGKGTYLIHAWANQQGAFTGLLEAMGEATYVLT